MTRLLGTEADAFFAALDQSPSRALRFDPEKVSLEELRAALGDGLGKPVPFAPNSFYFQFDSIGNHPLHHGGALYVQEPAAMAPVAALGERKFRWILDLCAAPGGKSLQAAATCLLPDGVLVCNEPNPARRKTLMQNLERMGQRRCAVTGFDGTDLPREWEGRFDLVICDAPCSGEGMMRKSESAVEMWSEENVFLCARRQEKILESAHRALASGGVIVYSTCTWAPEENEERVLEFLSRHPEYTLLPPAPAVASSAVEGLTPHTARFYPHRFEGEGQFLALLQHRGEKEAPRPEKKKEKKERPNPDEAAVRNFLKETLTDFPREKLVCRGENWFLLPDENLPVESLVSPGVCIGSVQKGRLKPHHRFFLAYAPFFREKLTLSLSDPRVEGYLRGEEIPVPDRRAYLALFVGNCPLGGVKASGGVGKNYYPKGLRKP